ncbi:MAG TPA: Wzz/FepE/Etk N-terminal domain-containing protein [Syntrophales bacterium]|nr:Wzz/FepE/Etk N-terminal domain-containing protein [Syntrophales bacterium]
MGEEDTKKEEFGHLADGVPGDEAMVQLMDFWLIVRRRKRFISRFVLTVLILTAMSTLLMKDVYQATAVISPIAGKDTGGTLSALAQQIGGLTGASLLGAPASANDIMNFLNSNILREKVIERNNLLPVLFPDEWDWKQNRWKKGWLDGISLNPLVYVERAARMLQPGPVSQKQEKSDGVPDMWDGLRKLDDMVTVKNNLDENSITIAVTGPNPDMAARIVEHFLTALNDHMSSEARRVVLVNRKYLEEQLDKTADPFIRQNIYNMIAQQIERSMTVEAKENFAFKVIDPPRAPDRKFKPQRMQIVLVSLFLSLFMAIAVVFVLENLEGWKNFLKERENEKPFP